jgi:hypothetical protein
VIFWFSLSRGISICEYSKIINDFKEHGYNATKILKGYLRSLSIKLEIKTHQANIGSLQNQTNDLTNSVTYWEEKINQHKQRKTTLQTV